MGCDQSKEQEEPVKPVETKPAVEALERKRSPTPDKEIQDQGTLFALMPTDDNEIPDGHGQPMAVVPDN